MTTEINLDLVTVPGVKDVLLERAALQRRDGVVGMAEYLEVLACGLEPIFDAGDPQTMAWADRLKVEGDAILTDARASEHPAHRAAAWIIADEVARLRISVSGGEARTLN